MKPAGLETLHRLLIYSVNKGFASVQGTLTSLQNMFVFWLGLKKTRNV